MVEYGGEPGRGKGKRGDAMTLHIGEKMLGIELPVQYHGVAAAERA